MTRSSTLEATAHHEAGRREPARLTTMTVPTPEGRAADVEDRLKREFPELHYLAGASAVNDGKEIEARVKNLETGKDHSVRFAVDGLDIESIVYEFKQLVWSPHRPTRYAAPPLGLIDTRAPLGGSASV